MFIGFDVSEFYLGHLLSSNAYAPGTWYGIFVLLFFVESHLPGLIILLKGRHFCSFHPLISLNFDIGNLITMPGRKFWRISRFICFHRIIITVCSKHEIFIRHHIILSLVWSFHTSTVETWANIYLSRLFFLNLYLLLFWFALRGAVIIAPYNWFLYFDCTLQVRNTSILTTDIWMLWCFMWNRFLVLIQINSLLL